MKPFTVMKRDKRMPVAVAAGLVKTYQTRGKDGRLITLEKPRPIQVSFVYNDESGGTTESFLEFVLATRDEEAQIYKRLMALVDQEAIVALYVGVSQAEPTPFAQFMKSLDDNPYISEHEDERERDEEA